MVRGGTEAASGVRTLAAVVLPSSSPRYTSSHKVGFTKDENLFAGLAHLQEQLSSVGSEITLKYMLRAIGGVQFTDHVCIVSRSPCKLRWMMAVVFEVFGGAFDLAISERNI